MVRFLALAVLVILVALLLRAVVLNFLEGLRGSRGGAAPRALRDDLVKDPVCATYIPRRKAVARRVGAGTHYFCSVACADRHARRA